DLGPLRTLADDVSDFIQRYVALGFDRECLTVATHGADANAEAINGNRLLIGSAGTPKNLVRFNTGLPFFPGYAVLEVGINPRNQVATQRYTEMLRGQRRAFLCCQNATIDFQNCRRGVIK